MSVLTKARLIDNRLWIMVDDHTLAVELSWMAGKTAGEQMEREACALLTEKLGIEGYGMLAIAAALRARGQS